MATHSSVLAWRIPGMGEPGGLPSMGSHRAGHDWSNLAVAAARHHQAHSQNKGLSRASPAHPPAWWKAGEGSQSQKQAIAAPERHYLPNCKQVSLLTKTSWDFGQLTSTWEGAPVVHPENQVTGTGEAINCSDHARQTPGNLSCSDLGRTQNVGPTESAPLKNTRVPEPKWLRPGKYIQPRAGLRQFPAEQPRAWAV